jgi:hypothetical protein
MYLHLGQSVVIPKGDITCCQEEKLEGLKGGRAFHIHNGKLV